MEGEVRISSGYFSGRQLRSLPQSALAYGKTGEKTGEAQSEGMAVKSTGRQQP